MNTHTTWTTTDIALAAWVACHLGPPACVDSGRTKWARFTFNDQAACRAVCVLYPSSEAHRFDAAVRALRKVEIGHDWPAHHPDIVAWPARGVSLAAYAVVRGAALQDIDYTEDSTGRPVPVFLFSGGDGFVDLAGEWQGSKCRDFDEWVRRLKRSRCQ